MSDVAKGSWPQLYKKALLESDRRRLPARIEEAQIAIQHRARELWYGTSPITRERNDLDNALHFLRLLRMVEIEK